jgi:hypothetical protein
MGGEIDSGVKPNGVQPLIHVSAATVLGAVLGVHLNVVAVTAVILPDPLNDQLPPYSPQYALFAPLSVSAGCCKGDGVSARR